MGHAKSMNLLGRYLEEGRFCPAERVAAHEWYRRSAEAGDFRGPFSHAAVLADQGQIGLARRWLERALEGGNLKFLRVSRQALQAASEPAIRAMALAYHERAAELGDESDRAAGVSGVRLSLREHDPRGSRLAGDSVSAGDRRGR